MKRVRRASNFPIYFHSREREITGMPFQFPGIPGKSVLLNEKSNFLYVIQIDFTNNKYSIIHHPNIPTNYTKITELFKTKSCRIDTIENSCNFHLQIIVKMANFEHFTVPKFPGNGKFHSRETGMRLFPGIPGTGMAALVPTFLLTYLGRKMLTLFHECTYIPYCLD